MSSKRRSLLLLICFIVLSTTKILSQTYTSVVVFGDSLSDTGNFAHVAQTSFLLRYPGPTFNYTDGRFTNGADTTPAARAYMGVWIEQVARQFAAKPAVKNSLDGGTNFAYGDATTEDGLRVIPVTAGLSLSVHNMGLQVTDYLGTNPTPSATTLYVLYGGANDLFADSSTPAVTAAVQRESALVQRLVNAGATNFLIPNLPPLGGSDTSPAGMALNVASATFRALLAASLQTIKTAAAANGKTLQIVQPDIFAQYSLLAANPMSFGFSNLSTSAQTLLTVNPDTYLFWDTVHPTTTGHHVIAAVAENLLAPLAASSTALTITPALTTAGQAVTLKAVVTGTGPSTKASGLITFFSGTGPTATAIAATTLDATGTATATFSPVAAGSPYSITAVYAGDTAFLNSTSPAQSLVLGTPIATAITLTASPTTVNLGAAVTLTATATSSIGAPSGTVTFLDGTSTLGTGTLNASGVATLSTTTLTAGTHSITASYAASGVSAGSTSTAVSVVVTAPALTIAFSPSTLTIARGASSNVTVSVTPLGGASGAVNLSCGTLPARVTCAFSPAAVTLSGSTAQTSTLTIGTMGTNALAIPIRPGSNPASTAVYAFTLIPLMGLGLATRRRRWPIGHLLTGILFIGAMTLGVSGCASGNSASTTTAPGTYSIVVTATSAGTTTVTGQATLTVNVQ